MCSNNDSCYSLIFMTQCTHTYKHACTNTCIHTYCTCTKHTQTLTHAHTYAYTHTNSNIYTHIYANTYILTHAHRYTHLKIYTQIHLLSHMHIYLPNRYIHIHLSTNTEKKAMKWNKSEVLISTFWDSSQYSPKLSPREMWSCKMLTMEGSLSGGGTPWFSSMRLSRMMWWDL